MSPDLWKTVTRSPAALKTFKRNLRDFRSVVQAKKQTEYIPVTMDELMARLVTNIDRLQCMRRFKQEKKLLDCQTLHDFDNKTIEDSCKQTLGTLNQLLGHNTIYMERQPNIENHLYFKLMERA